jgi:hypothetical protein
MKEKLIRVVLKSYEPIDKDVDISLIDGAQLFEGRWMMPSFGCDTLQKLIDDINALLERVDKGQ